VIRKLTCLILTVAVLSPGLIGDTIQIPELLPEIVLCPQLTPDPRIEIASLRYHTHANFTRIVIDIGRLREYIAGEDRKAGRLTVDILQARLNAILQDQAYPVRTDYLSQILVFQKAPATARVSVELDFTRVASTRVYHLFDPFRIVIDIYPKLAPQSGFPVTGNGSGGAQPPAPPPVKSESPGPAGGQAKPQPKPDLKSGTASNTTSAAKPPDPLAAGYTMARQLGLGVKTIVLDPGHGGSDPGCLGRSGLKEKDVALDIALELKKALVEKGFVVTMTRESDVFIPLEDRPVVANQRRADLFISVHINATPNRKREGVETFFLNFSPDPEVNATAARENATSTHNISQMKDIIQKIVQNSKVLESRDLAERLHADLLRTLSDKGRPMKSLGVKGGPFWVLIGGEMPSVLVEVSHLSNAREEALLKTPAWKARIVRGLTDGIMGYVHSLGKG
jgi:N-acetylmuramoyl-L-alanine amidase